MAKATKLPSGSWRAVAYLGVSADGKRIRKSFTAPTKKEAEMAAIEYALHTKATTESKLTLGGAMEKYIALKSNVLSPSTIRGYRNLQRNHLAGLLNVPLANITQADIQQAINAEAENHSPKTVRNVHGLLTAVFSVYRPDFTPHTTLPQRVKQPISIPNNDDIKLILRRAEGSALELPIMLAAFGSLRRSEICALTHEDISGNTVFINKALVQNDKKQWRIKTTKTVASTRKIELPAFVIDKIPAGKGPIFHFNPQNLSQNFYKFLRKENLPIFRFHDLRHYQASILHAMGVPDKYIMQRGGWSTDATLKNIYQHTFDDLTEKTNERVNEYFSKMINDN